MSQPDKNGDLHGSAPDHCPVALLLLDVINHFDFPQGDQLLRHAMQIKPRLRQLIDAAKAAGIPVVYVNDNFGRWRSNFPAVVERCVGSTAIGCDFVHALQPAQDDYFVLKPKHSGFFGTTLEILLQYLGTKTVIVAGLTGDMCVQFTAQDAYMRELGLIVPQDCVASTSQDSNDLALEQMKSVLKADIRPVAELDLRGLVSGLHDAKVRRA